MFSLAASFAKYLLRHRRGIGLTGLLLLALALRTQHLGGLSVWIDDAFSLKMMELTPQQIWRQSALDTLPPLYYWLLQAWATVCGPSPAAMRLSSALCGVAAVLGVYLLVYEAYRDEPSGRARSDGPGRGSAGLAALLVALSPVQISWSMQVRQYALGTALVAGSSWLLLRALRRPPPRMFDWSAYTLLASLLTYTHYFGFFTLAAQCLFAAAYLLHRDRLRPRSQRLDGQLPLLCSVSVAGLLFQPWLPQFWQQRQRVLASFWSGPFDWETFGAAWCQLLALPRFGPAAPIAGLLLAQVCFVVLLLMLLGRRWGDLFLALAAAVPVGAAIVHSVTARGLIAHRYFVFAHLFIMAAAAVVAGRVPWRVGRWLVIASLIAVQSGLAWRYSTGLKHAVDRPGLQRSVERFNTLARPGEIMLVYNPMVYMSAVVYADDRTRLRLCPQFNGRPYPYYEGTAAILDHEFQPVETLDAEPANWVWTLGSQRWGQVSLPKTWVCVSETNSPDFFAELTLRLYRRADPATARDAAVNPQKAPSDSRIRTLNPPTRTGFTPATSLTD
jgi:4-amino-4-deoxy-L-arabinose transferase-like glycosyltransferase